MGTATSSRGAYSLLKSRIVSRSIPIGERLTEARVSKLLGVGRGPARETLLRLEAEGLIRKNGRYGRRYVQYHEDQNPRTHEQQFEVREVLDGLAARNAALNMTGRQVNELRAMVAEVFACIERGDGDGRYEALARFYDFLRFNCGNAHIRHAIDGAGIFSLRVRSEELERRIVEVIKENSRKGIDLESVVEAIASHDPRQAEARMRAWTQSMARAVCGG